MAGNQFINTFARQVMRSAVQIAMAFGIKKGIDLLAMGAYGHSRIRQFLVGSTTSTLLRTSNSALLILR